MAKHNKVNHRITEKLDNDLRSFYSAFKRVSDEVEIRLISNINDHTSQFCANDIMVLHGQHHNESNMYKTVFQKNHRCHGMVIAVIETVKQIY